MIIDGATSLLNRHLIPGCIVIKPPQPFREYLPGRPSLFLAGSIEQGTARHWQKTVTEALVDFNVLVLNPRRDTWDSTWIQSIHNKQFKEQVTWELDGLDAVDRVFIYFDPETKAPISLLEMGAFVSTKNCTVVCPDGFYRKGNVDIFCERHHTPVYETLEQGIAHLKNELQWITAVRTFER